MTQAEIAEVPSGQGAELPVHRCAVCGYFFPLDDMELLEDDEQACLRCAHQASA